MELNCGVRARAFTKKKEGGGAGSGNRARARYKATRPSVSTPLMPDTQYTILACFFSRRLSFFLSSTKERNNTPFGFLRNVCAFTQHTEAAPFSLIKTPPAPSAKRTVPAGLAHSSTLFPFSSSFFRFVSAQ